MPWVLLYVLVAAGGLVVLAACGIRVFGAVRELGREVRRTEERLAPRLAALEQAAEHGHLPQR